MVKNAMEDFADFRSLWGTILRWAERENLERPSKIADSLTETAKNIVRETMPESEGALTEL